VCAGTYSTANAATATTGDNKFCRVGGGSLSHGTGIGPPHVFHRMTMTVGASALIQLVCILFLWPGLARASIVDSSTLPRYVLTGQPLRPLKLLSTKRTVQLSNCSLTCSFTELGRKYMTDKVSHHGYDRYYPLFLEWMRLQEVKETLSYCSQRGHLIILIYNNCLNDIYHLGQSPRNRLPFRR
jgi:hypothetical protein